MTIIYFILVLGVIIFVHELGHFIFAKLSGIYVYEFALGMGPKILHYKKKGGETEYSLRLIPIGGFCSLAGEGTEGDEKIPKDRLLQSKTFLQRLATMFFGAGFNFIFALLLLFFIGIIWGAPKMDPVLTDVTVGSAAQQAGLQAGDRVIKLDGHKVNTMDDLSLYIAISKHDKPTTFVVNRKGIGELTIKVTPEKKENKDQITYVYGISTKAEKEYGIVPSLKYMVDKTGSLFKQMWVTLSSLFTGDVKLSQLSGPVGIYSIVGEQSKGGLSQMLYLVAFLSINVGFINLIPFPAFDGGRIIFLFIEKIKGSPIKPETENMIHSIGFFLLIALMIYITFQDILRLF